MGWAASPWVPSTMRSCSAALERSTFRLPATSCWGARAVEVATRRGADPRATEMLLNALASLLLLVKREGVFHNSPSTARYFTAGSRDNARPALLHTAHLRRRWSTLTDCVRAGAAVAHDESAGSLQDWTEIGR